MSSSELDAETHALGRKTRFLWLWGRRTQLAKEGLRLGQDCRKAGLAELAETNFQRVVMLFQGFAPINATKRTLEAFSMVAASHNHLGLLCLDANRPSEGVSSFDKAIDIRRELRRLFPQDRENEIYLGGALCNRAHAVADSDATAAAGFYQQSLAVLRQPNRTCECSYWDEQRQSWWCSQLEALGVTLQLQWVALAPQFIDNAVQGMASLASGSNRKAGL